MESAEVTTEMVEKVYSESNILDFSNRDVTDVSILAIAADMGAREAFLRYRETHVVLHSGEGGKSNVRNEELHDAFPAVFYYIPLEKQKGDERFDRG